MTWLSQALSAAIEASVNPVGAWLTAIFVVMLKISELSTALEKINPLLPGIAIRVTNAVRWLTTVEVEALSPYEGEAPDPIVYATSDQIAACTAQAVERCLKCGFSLEDVAIVNMRGRARSALQGLDKLGPWTLSHFTGRYDEDGTPVWAEGQLLIESVRRFKGQAAPAVVLTECDLAQLDPMNRRLLFVGLTRARVHLEWVMSVGTAGILQELL